MKLLESLYQKALQARNHAYAPYSGFSVGAALVSENGNMYAGSNVENASYPCGTCAEAGAISAMIAGGDKIIKDIVIVSGASDLIVPCGACLQRLREFSDEKTTIHLANLTKIEKSYKLSDLLPVSFSAEDLKK